MFDLIDHGTGWLTTVHLKSAWYRFPLASDWTYFDGEEWLFTVSAADINRIGPVGMLYIEYEYYVKTQDVVSDRVVAAWTALLDDAMESTAEYMQDLEARGITEGDTET